MYQQGDVLIKAVEKIPVQRRCVHRTKRGYILAEGEATGHAHSVLDEIEMFEANGMKFISATHEFTVVHEEHGKITVPSGIYEIDIVQEYDHFAEEVRHVVD